MGIKRKGKRDFSCSDRRAVHQETTMVWKLYLYIMVLGAMCACALPENPSTSLQLVRKRETSHRYCGRYLVSVLHLVCGGNYYVDEDKRSAEDVDWALPQTPEYGLEVDFPFRSRPSANSMTNKHFRRHTRSGAIVDECCIYKGCTISELTEYCQAR